MAKFYFHWTLILLKMTQNVILAQHDISIPGVRGMYSTMASIWSILINSLVTNPIAPQQNNTSISSCPLNGSIATLSPGPNWLNLSRGNEVCGIYIQSKESFIPVARSYENGFWEAAPGPKAIRQQDILCTESRSCSVLLPHLDDPDEGYVIRAQNSSVDQAAQIAQFLEMTTFGPTKSEIKSLNDADWGENSRAAYVQNQMSMPATSHREYYRRRTNVEWGVNGNEIARSDHPCSSNSKWRRYSFVKQDMYATNSTEFMELTFETVPEEKDLVTTIYEADSANDVISTGQSRFENSLSTKTTGYSGEGFYNMRDEGNWIEWAIDVSKAGVYPLSFRYAIGGTDNKGYRPLDVLVNDAKIHIVDCIYTGSWRYWRYTDLVDVDLNQGSNTIKLLVSNGFGGPFIDHMRLGKPPAVILKANGSPRTIARNGVGILDEWGFELFSGTFHSFPDTPGVIPQGSVQIISPSDGKPRYLDIGNPPVDFTGYERFLPLNYFKFTDDDIFASATSHLFSYPLLEGQELIKTTLTTTEICTDLPPAPVFGHLPNGDWIIWSPIIQLEDNGPSVNTPPEDMKHDTLIDGGGSAVLETGGHLKCANVARSFVNEETCKLSNFNSACSSTQTAETNVTGGVIVCGSVGEVSNDPTLNQVFDIQQTNMGLGSTVRPDILNNQKQVIWTEINLFGGDQLRQRVAWALAQIFTVVPTNINAYGYTEMYTNYYDIFVRHAFGNYRDILGEISYSPLMATHLSYWRSKSMPFIFNTENKRTARADENFAREVMQLFTLGQVMLNDDGTPLLDFYGNTIDTYSNEAIKSFSRAWTGFDGSRSRANIEEDRRSWIKYNRLDPMQIVPDWRDPFPKSNLLRGFIGDYYELCADMSTHSFLKKGARYRFLGGSPSPDLVEDTWVFTAHDVDHSILRAELDQSSPLFQTLYNGGNYKLNVVLEDDIECTGIECLVDTLRVVKIGDVYFEFVLSPCIQLAFYNNGKKIQRLDNSKEGILCANPDLHVAREACCNQTNYREVRSAYVESGVTYLYDGERMAYATAEDRCDSLCTFSSISGGSGKEWFRKGYHWTNNDCGINVKVNPEGYVAIVHDVDSSYKDTVPYHVDESNTLNWFQVYWDGSGDYPGSNIINTCAANKCKTLDDGNCLCKTKVIESVVFTYIDNVSKNDVLSQLFIATIGPQADSVQLTGDGFNAHVIGNNFDEHTVFEVVVKGRTMFLKNVRSTVIIEGWERIPEILEAEDAIVSSAAIKSDTISATAGSYVEYDDPYSSVEWILDVDIGGTCLVSFRYALDSAPTPLSIFVNSVDATQDILFYPTGGWTDDWLYSNPLEVNLTAGQNTIRTQVSDSFNSGPNIDHIKIEGITVTSTPLSSFRNPPHFMSLIPDYAPYGTGEQNVRDAQYETDAVLDHYFHHDNVAPFLCTRIIKRFGISNPSPRYLSECSKAFKTGSYFTSGSIEFGSGMYGDLEATVAAIVLDKEATSPVIKGDPSHGSLKEPIMKVLGLMRSMEYKTRIPDIFAGMPMHKDFHVRLWQISEKIGQSAYEFPTVFSFFLNEYIPDSGPALAASLTSPESMLITMPTIIPLLNGMFSLIKYGLGDCNDGFSTYPGYSSCFDDGRYERSFGYLTYEPDGSTIREKITDLALLLTAGRMGDVHLNAIEQACSPEVDHASIMRCAQQLIVTTGEFHSTNRVLPSGADRTTSSKPRRINSEPYQAIVYLQVGGGLDSFNMLVPYTCSPIDVYNKYRMIRGKNENSEGVGLPIERLLEIQSNNSDQPCTSFGIHENLTVLKDLYDHQDVIFIANAGLLAKSVDMSNYEVEAPGGLFSHDTMTLQTAREDLAGKYSGTGVGGRIADVLTKHRIPTNMFSIFGEQLLLTGEAGQAPMRSILSSSGMSDFNADPSINNMTDVILALNDATTGFFAETWSLKLADIITQHSVLKTKLENALVTTPFPNSGIADQLKMVTRLMQTAETRGVTRDIFFVADGGYDTHTNVDATLTRNFANLNAALEAFVAEVKTLNLWESTTLVQFSEFGRTLDPNTNFGSDHGWGGIHFMMGGAVNGGKVLGKYPDDFEQSDSNHTNPIALGRGRMIPTHPWDAMWYGTAQWFGVTEENDMEKVLPMWKNFDSDLCYNASELFTKNQTESSSEFV